MDFVEMNPRIRQCATLFNFILNMKLGILLVVAFVLAMASCAHLSSELPRHVTYNFPEDPQPPVNPACPSEFCPFDKSRYKRSYGDRHGHKA